MTGKTIKQINKAMPESARSNSEDTARAYEDMRRELNPGFAFEGGAKVIEVWSLFVREIDGTIGVTSRVGQGTCFTIELPLKPEKRNRKDVRTYY